MKTLTANMIAQKIAHYNRPVLLLEVDADAPDVGVTTLYYGHRDYTLTNNYVDALAGRSKPFKSGITTKMGRVRLGGGLASVQTFGVQFRNEGKLASTLTDTYFLENDVVRLCLVFETGSEVVGDIIPISTGVIENFPYGLAVWNFDVIDGSDKDFRDMPAEIIDLILFPFAPLDTLGKVINVPFGEMDLEPAAKNGAGVFLAPAKCVDEFLQVYSVGLNLDAWGQPYQNYAEDKRLASITNYTRVAWDASTGAWASAAGGAYFQVDDARRKVTIYPNRPDTTNDITTWYVVADDDSSTSVSVGTTDSLDLFFGGMNKVGTLVSADIKVDLTSGTAAWDLKLDGSSLTTGSDSGDFTISLAAYLANWDEDWDFEVLSLEINGSGGAVVVELVYLELNYDDQGAVQATALEMAQAVSGVQDKASRLNDGAVISSDGLLLENPVHQLQYMLRSKVLLNQAVARVDTTSFDAADDDRSTWKFRFSMTQQADAAGFLNAFCFQAGLHLFIGADGTWKCVAQEKTRAAQHTFIWDWNLATRPGTKEPLANFSRTPIRDIINEVALRYSLNRATGEYEKLKVRSGKFRETSTCAVVASTVTLTDAAATFLTGDVPAFIGEHVYIESDQDYTILTIPTDTTLTLVSVSGDPVADTSAGTTYWRGPNVRGAMIRSQARYKTENPLGSPVRAYETEQGGFTSDFIQDDTTAEAFLDQLQDWRSQRRLRCVLHTYLNAVDVELGDVAYLEHPWIPASRSAIALDQLGEAIDTSETNWTVDIPAVWRVDDYILVDNEIVKVTGVNASDIDVTRAQANTEAATHADNAAIYRITRKWEVTGLRLIPDQMQYQVELQEMPHDYTPTGICVADLYPDSASATLAQLLSAGWVTYNSGRVFEEDEDSNYSHAG